MSSLRLYLTGEPMVEWGSNIVRGHMLGGRQGALVFTMLAWEHRRAVPRGELAEALWEREPPGSWETTLSAIVSNLRKGLSVIEGVAVEHALGCYQLVLPANAWVDVEGAHGAVHQAEGAVRMGEMQSVYAWSGVASTITGRPFLAGEHTGWVESRRRELRSLRVRALECAIEFCIWNREWGPATRYAESLIGLDALREASYRLLMRVGSESGDRALAVRAYERCRVALAEALGVSPHADTESLFESVLGER